MKYVPCMYLYPCLLVVWTLAGCQLHKSSPVTSTLDSSSSVIMTETHYQNHMFSVRRPNGWRVITTPHTSAQGVIFSAADDRALVYITLPQWHEALRPANISSDSQLRQLKQEVQINHIVLTVYAAASVTDWPQIEMLLAQIIASLKTVQ